ncbi:hypothetical protein L7F22_035378, partial [Adiantum nelumboides]|nr:hypothetical protein [Adiantum nelumboides]
FWCAYGPKSASISCPQHNAKSTSKNVTKMRPPLKKGMLLKGCQCHFMVKREPDVGLISYVYPYHTNKDEEVCHGSFHHDASSKFSPWISLHKKVWVLNMLFRGFSPQQVMENHIQTLHAQRTKDSTYSMVKDDFLCIRDILNIASKLAIEQYQMHDNDAKSVQRWCLENGSNIFIYQHQDYKKGLEFILGVQTPWQREMCYRHGNGNLNAMDATFGTNKYKFMGLLWLFYLYTMLVFDSHCNGVPIAWVITSSTTFESICTWMTCFRDHMLDHYKSWEPRAFMVDDAEQEINAL